MMTMMMMSNEATRLEPATYDDWTRPGLAWASALAQNASRVQQLQIDALLAWQAAAVALNNEIWDEWRCRFGGGAPIDV